VFVPSDWWHTANVPTIPLTDSVSVLHRWFPFPLKQLNYCVGVSEILEQLVVSLTVTVVSLF